jgi:lysophospholipase L1-like esterase
MTVILQKPYAGQNVGTPYTGADEGALVAAGIASFVSKTDGVALSALSALSPAVQRAIRRTGRARIMFVGDSLTAGWGSGITTGYGSGNASDAGAAIRSKAYPAQVAALLAQAGIPTRSDAMYGSGNVGQWTAAETMAYYGTQLTLPTAWASGSATAGGQRFENSTDTSSLVFKPLLPADRFDVYYLRASGYGTATMTDASGTLATVNAAGTTLLSRITLSRDVASTLPISIQRTGVGGAFHVVAIEPYNSALPVVEILNAGGGGMTTGNWSSGTGGSAGPKAMLPFVAADLYVIGLGGNDVSAGVDATTFQTNLQTIATLAKGTGADVVLAKRHISADGGGNTLPASYRAAIDAVNLSTSGAFVVDYAAVSLTVPDDFYDLGHLTQVGYAKMASKLAPLLTTRLQQ